MNAAFLHHYEAELDYLRRALGEFEAAHPQKARALGVTAGRIADPDLNRLADSLALVSARLNARLDAALPEFALDLARILCPSLLLGAPSYAAVRLAAAPSVLTEPVALPAGSELAFGPEGAPDCLFVAARPVQLAPLALSGLRLEHAPFGFAVPEAARGAEAALCLTLTPDDPGTPLAELLTGPLELYVAAPAARKARLIEALSGDVVAVGAAAPDGDERATQMLEGGALSLVLDREDGAAPFLPGHPAEPWGLALLRDFLAYPDKAAFFALSGLVDLPAATAPGGVDLRIFLGTRAAQALTRTAPDDLAVNVVPVVNCFEALSEPLRHDFTRPSVPLTPRREGEMHVEVLQVQGLRALTPEGELPLPEVTTPARTGGPERVAWQERFEIAPFDPTRRDISFSAPDAGDGLPDPIDVVATLLCSNGTEAFRPRPGATGRFVHDELAEIPFALLDEPTAPVPPDPSPARLWDMLALVGGNFAVLFDADDPAAGLRTALHLAAPAGHCEAAAAIDAVALSQSVAPLSVGGNVLLSAGTRIEVVIVPEALPYPPQVFAAVLRRFFAGFVSYDRFFQLVLRPRGQAAPLVSFAKIHGSQPCL